jgi:hypothetical protein
MIDWVVWEWIRLPGDERSRLFAEFLPATAITDERRPRYLMRVARDNNSAADMSNFVATYNRVRDLRNHVAHAMYFNQMDEGGNLAFGVPHYAGDARIKRLENQSSSVNDATLNNRERDLRWLMEVVEWVAKESATSTGPGGLNRTPKSVPPRSSRAPR